MDELRQAASVYLDRRMIVILMLGFASGLPRLLVYSTLTFWLIDVGIDIKNVGLFALVSLPYTFKVAWAPLLDQVHLGPLSDALGRRRAWILITQGAIACALLATAWSSPADQPLRTALCCLMVSLFSASQDIVIDAYRVDLLEDELQGAGAAMAVFGYRLGMLVASAGALYLFEFSGSWSWTYSILAATMGIGAMACAWGPKPASDANFEQPHSIGETMRRALVEPLRDLSSRRSWGLVLAFIVFYKLGDALAATMTNPFLVDLGFATLTIADIAKTYGLVASIVGVALGGMLVKALGVLRALLVAGVLQLVSNLVFCLQALVGAHSGMLIVTIGVEQLTGGLGTAAFVAYLSALCDRRYTATQYALLTAVASLLRTTLSSSTGFLAAALGWPLYFAATAAVASPALVLALILPPPRERDDHADEDGLDKVFA